MCKRWLCDILSAYGRHGRSHLCPYCYEQVEVYVDPETVGELIRDCDVCCRPWALQIHRSDEGELMVGVSRAQ